jgi:hypothetical protein
MPWLRSILTVCGFAAAIAVAQHRTEQRLDAIAARAGEVRDRAAETRDAVDQLRPRVDNTTNAIVELRHAVAPKADHMVCPAHDGHPEVDLGIPVACGGDQVGQCVRGLPVSEAAARCQAGKL